MTTAYQAPAPSPRRAPADLRDTWQVVAGAVLFPLGIAFVLLAWYGAAHTGFVQQQIPYLVSGSFLGLGLMIVGALLYFAHWLYRLYDQADLHHHDRLAHDEDLLRELITAVHALGVPVAAPPAAPPASPPSAERPLYLATRAGSTYHRPDCAVVTTRPERTRTITADKAATMQPCRLCEPDR